MRAVQSCCLVPPGVTDQYKFKDIGYVPSLYTHLFTKIVAQAGTRDDKLIGMAVHKKRKGRETTATKGKTETRRVVVQFPLSLYNEARVAIDELHINQANLVRLAVESFLEQRKHRKLEELLAEGYAANAELGRKVGEDFVWSDAELL